ncbi:MAG: hypothetical protein GY816_19745 [Cytophagales bacterium]|nr:hypothetical protein [Cytophagales bacterium]
MKGWGTYILFCFSMSTWAQDIPLNTWRSHFSYFEARILEQARSTLFCATTNGLFTVDEETNAIQKLSKEDGLGDARITAMNYSEQSSVMVIGYESGVIDLIDDEGTISTISTLRDAQVVADKAIHSISSVDEGVYLATDFGVVLLDVSAGIVKENYRNIGSIGAELGVQEILIQNDSIYILSVDGIRSGNLMDNLLDFNVWEYFPESSSGSFSNLISSEGILYVVRNETQLWRFNGTTWFDTGLLFSNPVIRLYAQTDLYALTSSGLYSVLPNPVELLADPLLIAGNDLIISSGDYWLADGNNGLLKIGTVTEQVLPDGIFNDSPTRIKWADGRTFAFFGPDPSSYDGTSDGLGYSVFEEGRWIQREIPDFYNLSDVTAIGNNLYFTSLGFGLYDEQQDLILNQDNSEFVVSNSLTDVQLAAIQTQENSLWAISYNSDNALYRLRPDGSISTFSSSELDSSFPLDLDISSEGVMWVTRGNNEGGGLATFDPFIDMQRTITTSDNLPSATVTGVAIDIDDEVWISTTSGVANFGAGSFPFSDLDVSIPIFNTGFLFEDEQVNDILTDGGGRIWFATETGVWVLSRDLSVLIHQFTENNSPLPSNNVLQFSYNQENGEVFILTDYGLVSYRSASSGSKAIHESQISVFPNPVPPGFAGTVGLSGLAQNAIIKITDARGRLVRELAANGGSASWDLQTFNQSRVQTGIYLVFSSSADGVETLVGKIAVIK